MAGCYSFPQTGDAFEFTFGAVLDDDSYTMDSSTDESMSAEEQSLRESAYNYQHENGRTYHGFRAPSYPFPNDAPELERLGHMHDLALALLGGRLFLAPLSASCPPAKVLDVATGTGQWAVAVGDAFPTAAVLGTDLSPIQPQLVPPNVSFFIDDATDGEWRGGAFDGVDFVHARFTAGCWASYAADVVAKAFRALQPGGWLECQEMDFAVHTDDGPLPKHSALAQWACDLDDCAARLQRPFVRGARLASWLVAAGFVDVREHVFQVPLGEWPRERSARRAGRLWHRCLVDGLPALSYALLHRALGHSRAQIDVSLVDVRKALRDPHVHAYTLFYVVYGRKPGKGRPWSSV